MTAKESASGGSLRQRKGKSLGSKDTASNRSVGEAKAAKSETAKARGLLHCLFDPVDNSTLICFRVMWGLIMAYECYTFIAGDYRKLERYYLRSDFYPKYYGFTWVHAWPGNGLYIHIWVMLVAGLFVAVGFLYRLSSTVFFLGWCYIILLDSCLYLNHFYLIALMAFLSIIFPANADKSVDAYIWPSIRSNTMPVWILWLLRFEQVLVYFYAGVAKMNEDWMRGEPIRHWVPDRVREGRTMIPLQLASNFMKSELGVYFIAYGGLLFDTFAGFTLLFPRGVFFYCGLASCVFFHVSNKLLFNIGIFPYVMIASTTLFFEADWARKVNPYAFGPGPTKQDLLPRRGPLKLGEKLTVVLLALIVVHQVVTPIRFHAYPGNVAWNEYGHRYSWRMKLRDKTCQVQIAAQHPVTNATYPIDFESHLFGKQARKIKPRPELVVQFAHYIADTYTDSAFDGHRPRVYAHLECSLNYRPMQTMIPPDVDLAAVEWGRWPYDFITELEPLDERYSYQFPWNWSWVEFRQLVRTAFKPRAAVRRQEVYEERRDQALERQLLPDNNAPNAL